MDVKKLYFSYSAQNKDNVRAATVYIFEQKLRK